MKWERPFGRHSETTDRDKSRDRERVLNWIVLGYWTSLTIWTAFTCTILFGPFPFSHFDSGATGYCGPSRSTKADLPRCGTNVSAPMQCASLGRCHGQCRDARCVPDFLGVKHGETDFDHQLPDLQLNTNELIRTL